MGSYPDDEPSQETQGRVLSPWGRFVGWHLTLLLCLFLVSCSPEQLFDPPRAVTQTAQASLAATQDATPTPRPTDAQIVEAQPTEPTVERLLTVEVVEPLRVWVNEISAEHRAAAAAIGVAFEAQTGRAVAFQFIAPLQVGDLAEVAQANDQLPDLILHSREQLGGLLAAEILDVETATAISAELNLTTAANQLYPLPNGQVPALPSDGYQYMLFYRSDWLGSDFVAPDSFVNIESIAKTFHNMADEELPEDAKLIAGIAAPTEQNLPSTQRIFEWLAIANGCQLVDQKGEILLTLPACIDTLDYYKTLIFNYSPPDFQTELTTIRAYIDGRTAMMLGTASDLPIIVGENPDFPLTCAECVDNRDYLAANTGIVMMLTGRSETAAPVNMNHVRLLGMTVDADEDAAAFAKFWFTDGYLDWLAVEPERKVPFYEPAVDAWRNLPVISGSTTNADLIPQAMAQQREGLLTASRWGIAQGHGDLLSETYATKPLLAPFVLRYLAGLVTVEESGQELNDAITDTIPLYQFYPTPTPEPTEEPE